MPKFKDLTGKVFGKLTVLERADSSIDYKGKKRTRWLCVCECGNKKSILSDNLIGGKTKSCGCGEKENLKNILENKKTHGMCHTNLYSRWINMKSRCYNKNDDEYENYGKRGISVCEEWKNNFLNFYDWAINNGFDESLTIDRVDVNGNYEPKNCRWATQKEQARNKRNNVFITYKGKTLCLSDWAKICGVDRRVIKERLDRGWSVERAFS